MQPPEDPTPAAAPPKRPRPRAPAGAAAAVPLPDLPFLMHHQIKPLTSLTAAEAADLGACAAERGDSVKDANPFAQGTVLHIAFIQGFDHRAEELEVVA